MNLDFKNGGCCHLYRINNHAITRIVKRQSSNTDLETELIVFTECAIEKSNDPLLAMTHMVFHTCGTFHASPALISTNPKFKVADDDRSDIESVVSESTVALLMRLKMKGEFDPKMVEVVSKDDFAEMLSECC